MSSIKWGVEKLLVFGSLLGFQIMVVFLSLRLRFGLLLSGVVLKLWGSEWGGRGSIYGGLKLLNCNSILDERGLFG